MALPPLQDTAEAIAAQARRTAAHMVKCRARDYARRPMWLEALYPGLAAARPQALIAVAEHLLEIERKNPRRWFGFGGEVKALNAKAALLLGRALRRAEQRSDLRGAKSLNYAPSASASFTPSRFRCRRTTTSTLAIS